MGARDIEQDHEGRRGVDQAAAVQEPGVLTADEAAALLKISRSHFYKLVRTGRAPGPIRLGRAVRWLRQELDAWLEAGAPPRVRWEQTKAARRKTQVPGWRPANSQTRMSEGGAPCS